MVQGHFQKPSHCPSPSAFILTMQSTVIFKKWLKTDPLNQYVRVRSLWSVYSWIGDRTQTLLWSCHCEHAITSLVGLYALLSTLVVLCAEHGLWIPTLLSSLVFVLCQGSDIHALCCLFLLVHGMSIYSFSMCSVACSTKPASVFSQVSSHLV